MLLGLVLAGCSSNPLDSLNPFKPQEDEAQRGTIGFVQGFFGGVATDEPRAAVIGREILSAGGTAADGAVAVTLALSLTLPSSAGLGGGGVCVIHDAAKEKRETLDFLPGTPGIIPPGTLQATAVPGLLRGLAALHSRYGRLKWRQLVSPAENLTRFGYQVSRAYASDLKQVSPTMLADPGFLRFLTFKEKNRLIREGDFVKQLALSSVLSRVRSQGAGDFYTGLLSRQLVAAVKEAGGSLSRKDLRDYTPRWRASLRVPYIKATTFHLPNVPGGSGVVLAQMLGMLIKHGDWDDAEPAERLHLLSEVSARAYGAYWRNLGQGGGGHDLERQISKDAVDKLYAGFQKDRHTALSVPAGTRAVPPRAVPGTSFIVVDREGSAVACSLTMNGLFGAGRVAGGMGIVLAQPAPPPGTGPGGRAVMLLVNETQNTFYFGAAASGGIAPAGSLAGVAAYAIMGRDEENLVTALSTKRVLNSGFPDTTYYEQGLDGAIVQDLTRRGHSLSPAASLGLVNAVFCPAGIPHKKNLDCSVRNDPRGFGLFYSAE